MRSIAIAIAVASSCAAAGPIATVNSSEPFTIGSHAVTTAGITSWPVVAGDAVATPNSPAVLHFRDGSSVSLSSGSSIKLSGSAEQPKVLLLTGTLDYKLVAGSKVAITRALGAKLHANRASASGNALAARMPPVSTFQ